MAELDAGVTDAEPAVRFRTFGDFGIRFRVILRTRAYADQYVLISEFMKRLHQRFRLEGIEIPDPVHAAPSR
ncbi:mechanosensitive ion channel family protein [Nocardia sp. NPDC005825]|uniref:mechanosensitive ion channel family protein n=1 Tax=unclassified Nocardia TaxID=2637762 RepID=UPI003409DC75